MNPLDNLFLNIDQAIRSLLAQYLPAWAVQFLMALLVAILLVVFAVLSMMYITLLERKVVGRMQDRIGPNRVGPLGLMQPIADAIKFLTKEDITPRAAHRWVYNLAPILIVFPAFMVWAVIPFGRGMVGTDLNIAFLYIIAISSTGTIAIFMAGWSSRNKYALLGAMRAVAQIISYEVPQILSVVGVLILAQSLSMMTIVESQRQIWYILLQPMAFVIFLISSVAEVNRTPFDIPEAESEIVAGYHIEYSGIKFGLYFIAEFTSAFAIAAIGATLFLGGWQGPILPAWLWFMIKTYLMVFVLMWLRGTLPRLRVDQLMNFAWKFLVPLALVNLLLAGLMASLTHNQGPLITFGGFLLANLLLVVGTVMAIVLYQERRERAAVLLEAEGA